jgi:hypothetical protein
MKAKKISSILLLVFVAVSIVVMVAKEVQRGPTPVSASPSDAAPVVAKDAKFVVYYFHGDLRCQTCNTIEEQSHDAIKTGFNPDLSSGVLSWRLVNFDEPENAHFRDDFDLSFSSVVVAEVHGDRVVRWKNLPDVWTLVRGSRQDFEAYIVQNTSDFIVGGGM